MVTNQAYAEAVEQQQTIAAQLAAHGQIIAELVHRGSDVVIGLEDNKDLPHSMRVRLLKLRKAIEAAEAIAK